MICDTCVHRYKDEEDFPCKYCTPDNRKYLSSQRQCISVGNMDHAKVSDDINKGTWYQSAASGLWYRERGAAGDICAIRTDGITEYQPEPPKERG